MPDYLKIRNLTLSRLKLVMVERFEAQTSSSWKKIKAVTLSSFNKDEIDNFDESNAIERHTTNVEVAPFSTERTRIHISTQSHKPRDEILRLTFSDENDGNYKINILTTSNSSEEFSTTGNTTFSLLALYFNGGFLTIFAKKSLKNWMRNHPNSTPLNALSIPGTHNSPTYRKALPSVRCQAVSPKEQLENGIRFFDIRVQVDDPNDTKSDELTLVHSAFPIALSGSKKFRPLYEKILAFLNANPSETVILSIKREGCGDATDENLARRLYDHYIDEKHWVMTTGIPTLGQARGKIVLFRRFNLNAAMRELYGKTGGIDASRWADNTANSKAGHVQVQDFYEVLESENIQKKTEYICEHCDRAAASVITLETASTRKAENSGLMFVNFLSASNFWKPGCWPDKIAEKINPAITQFLCEKHDVDTDEREGHGGTGVLVCDWVGDDGDWDLVKVIIGMNEKLLAKDVVFENRLNSSKGRLRNDGRGEGGSLGSQAGDARRRPGAKRGGHGQSV